MIEKFNDYLIIHYPKNKYTNIHKRIINKIYHNRYEVETYYRVNKIDIKIITKINIKIN